MNFIKFSKKFKFIGLKFKEMKELPFYSSVGYICVYQNAKAKRKLIMSAQIHQAMKQIIRYLQCHWTSQSKEDKERLFRIY